jgi:hypothetical protein
VIALRFVDRDALTIINAKAAGFGIRTWKTRKLRALVLMPRLSSCLVNSAFGTSALLMSNTDLDVRLPSPPEVLMALVNLITSSSARSNTNDTLPCCGQSSGSSECSLRYSSSCRGTTYCGYYEGPGVGKPQRQDGD